MDRKKKEKMATCCNCTQPVTTTKKDKKDLKWVKPELTDVSGRVMAQPYIRFT